MLLKKAGGGTTEESPFPKAAHFHKILKEIFEGGGKTSEGSDRTNRKTREMPRVGENSLKKANTKLAFFLDRLVMNIIFSIQWNCLSYTSQKQRGHLVTKLYVHYCKHKITLKLTLSLLFAL